MTRQELFKQLNLLCYNMSFEYNINKGGCCYVAAVIAEQLERFNISYKVSVAYDPCHYAIKVADRYINRDGFDFKHDGEFYDWDSHKLYTEYKYGDWNERYNQKWNLIVRTRITALFNKYGYNRT